MRIVLFTLSLVACSGVSDKGNGGDTGSAPTDDEGAVSGPDDTGEDDGDEWWETDDTGKDDDGEDHEGWMGFYQPSTEVAGIEYTDDGCTVSYTLKAERADDCADCEIAYWFTVETQTIEENENCPSSIFLDVGTVFGFGQGSEVIYEEEGLVVYSAYYGTDDTWTFLEGGFVFNLEDESGESLWMFGSGPAAPDHIGWLGIYAFDTAEGGVSYNNEGCFVEYAIALEPIEDSSDISQFAYSVTYTQVESDKTDTTSCPDSVIKSDEDNDVLGHGTTSIGGGYYALIYYDPLESVWSEIASGFSYHDDTEGESYWLFGLGPVTE